MVSAVALTPDGRYAVSGSTSGAVYAWDLATGAGRHLLTPHIAQINSAAISADGRHALTGGEDMTLRWWDLAEGHCLHQIKTTYVASAAMIPSAHHTISGMSDGSLLLWEIDWDYEFPTD
jgi:WD40 repeat protein